jgi:hypothetical protein
MPLRLIALALVVTAGWLSSAWGSTSRPPAVLLTGSSGKACFAQTLPVPLGVADAAIIPTHCLSDNSSGGLDLQLKNGSKVSTNAVRPLTKELAIVRLQSGSLDQAATPDAALPTLRTLQAKLGPLPGSPAFDAEGLRYGVTQACGADKCDVLSLRTPEAKKKLAAFRDELWGRDNAAVEGDDHERGGFAYSSVTVYSGGGYTFVQSTAIASNGYSVAIAQSTVVYYQPPQPRIVYVPVYVERPVYVQAPAPSYHSSPSYHQPSYHSSEPSYHAPVEVAYTPPPPPPKPLPVAPPPAYIGIYDAEAVGAVQLAESADRQVAPSGANIAPTPPGTERILVARALSDEKLVDGSEQTLAALNAPPTTGQALAFRHNRERGRLLVDRSPAAGPVDPKATSIVSR